MHTSLSMGGHSSVRKSKPQIRWTPERVKFLEDNYPTLILPKLTKAFNVAFGTSITDKAIGFQLTRRGIRKTPLQVAA